MEKYELERADSLGSFHGSAHSKSVTSSGFTGDSHSVSAGSDGEQQSDSRFEWRNQWQHAMFFLALTSSWSSFTTFDMEDPIFPTEHKVGVMQVMMVYVFLGCPLLLVQVFIGQFTRRGCLVIGEMMPVAYGLGFIMLLNSLVSGILDLYYCTILLFYILVALVNHPTPAWMMCLKKYYQYTPNCMGLKQIDLCEPCYTANADNIGPCYIPEVHNLSAILFMQRVVFDLEKYEKILKVPGLKLSIHLIVTTIILFIAVTRTTRDLDGPIRIWNMFSAISLTTMIAVILFVSHRAKGFLYFLSFSWKPFFDFKCWAKILKTLIIRLKLAEGGHILFGSYTPVTVNAAERSVYLSIVSFVALIVTNTFLSLLADNFLCQVNAKLWTFHKLTATEYMLAFYPQALGILAAAPFWGTLYFLIAFGLSLQSLIVRVVVAEASLSHEVIKSSYYLYTRILILIAVFLPTIVLVTSDGCKLVPMVYSYHGFFALVTAFLFLIAVVFYGFQRLFDDVFFLTGHHPSLYYRVSWFLCVIAMGICLFSYLALANLYQHFTVFTVQMTVLITTLLIGFLYKFVVYLKAKDLTSLLRPAEYWGPSDPEARMNRRLFNPRYEVRFRQRVERCGHRCLLGSIILKRTLEKELALVSNVLLEIEDNEEERKLKKDLIEALRLHRAVMSNFLAERAPGDVAIILKRHPR